MYSSYGCTQKCQDNRVLFGFVQTLLTNYKLHRGAQEQVLLPKQLMNFVF